MKKEIPEKIIEFINEHHVLTLATCIDNKPWCANCFYIFDTDENALLFSTDITTRHGQEAEINSNVAGSIVLETETIGKIQGLQFSGNMVLCEKPYLSKARKKYLTRFPYAIIKKTTLWKFEITYAKLTDNRLGFGTKLIWE